MPARKGPIRCEELPTDPPALPHLQAVRTTHTEPDSRTPGCETHSRTGRISSGKIVYGYEKRLVTGAVFVDLSATLRHGQPPTQPRQGARDDWRRTPDRPLRTMLESRRIFVVLNGKRAVGDDNETDYHREVYWQRCCSTSTPTTSTYTPKLITSSTQTTCASRRKETTSTTSKRTHVCTEHYESMTTYYDTNQLRANPSKDGCVLST